MCGFVQTETQAQGAWQQGRSYTLTVHIVNCVRAGSLTHRPLLIFFLLMSTHNTLDIPAITALAATRARELSLPYAGALTPHEAHAWIAQDETVRLVDVRTQAEWDWVGRVPGAIEIEWTRYPGGLPNTDFLAQLKASVPPDAPILFLCRSGARSNGAAAAATAAGLPRCYNVLEGFEGDKDANSQRSRVNGWRAAGLPWVQG
jgi:rhodanese-related sulfurtransferase